MRYGIEAMRRVSNEKVKFVHAEDIERPEMSLEHGLLRALRTLHQAEDAAANRKAGEEPVREAGHPEAPRSR